MSTTFSMNKKITLIVFTLFLLLSASSVNAFVGGNATYREGGWITVGNNHAGLYYGTIGTTHYVYEIQGVGSSVERNTLSVFIDGKTHYGYFENPSMSSNSRSNILATASALANNTEIGYTGFNPLSYSNTNTSGYIHPNHINNIRCDGVVEYSYEFNDVYVWGKASPNNSTGTPTNFDISKASNVASHGNLGYDDPWFELGPRVQRGGADATDPWKWTQLRVY